MTAGVLNVNVGLLGHVDSGKTSLAKCLSKVTSTACFDKHPQSKERGITIDLGFSSFNIDAVEKIKSHGFERVQFTLVDCPGHASLIRTIIGGVHIIDFVILVIDVTKGIQTQTAECLVLSQVAKKPLLVALNKIDLIDCKKRDEFIKKVSKKLEKTLCEISFKDTPFIPVIAKEDYKEDRGIYKLIEKLNEILTIPKRQVTVPLVLAIDHCFLIKGKGTVLTGTVLQGTIRINDNIEIPVLKEIKKVKSIQMFRNDVMEAAQGDRIGVCVKQFDPGLIERGLACSPGAIPLLHGVLISFNKVKYYKGEIASNNKYHISIGYETIIGRIKMFLSEETHTELAFENDYEYLESYDDDCSSYMYSLIEFEKPVYVPLDSVVIGSKLDVNIESKSCRLAFYGNILYSIKDKNDMTNLLQRLKLYSIKEKNGVVQNVLNEKEVIGWRLCKKHSSVQKFLNFKVKLSTGEYGYIESTFGQKDKLRIIIPEGLKPSSLHKITSLKKQRKAKDFGPNEYKEPVKIQLRFKRYLFDKDKRVSQNGMIQ